VGGRDFARLLEVGDCACDFQNTVIAARGQAEAFGSSLKQRSRFCADRRIRIQPSTDRESIAGYA
jgi:hypothetical protein